MKHTNIGSLEVLKWIALILMTGDHINKYLFNSSLPVLFEAGRLALPIFIFVLAYNLSREDALERCVHSRVKKHLFLFGVVSSVPYMLLNGHAIKIFPLNILFTLLVITLTIENIDKGDNKHYLFASLVFSVGGYFVEYWWPAILLGISFWLYLKKKNGWSEILVLSSCLMLYFINGNIWAIASIPVIYISITAPITIPRVRWAFYIYYPLHLSLFWLIRIPLKKAGYLFF